MIVQNSETVFELIKEGTFSQENFKEWLSDVNEELLNSVKISSEIDLIILKEWASAEDTINGDTYDSGYDSARSDVRDMLGL